ncbi:hypothetical protein HI914_06663 [Erysiphe necator]|nr:hypothetical protein HI914_06663 [Erysiphe necator]
MPLFNPFFTQITTLNTRLLHIQRLLKFNGIKYSDKSFELALGVIAKIEILPPLLSAPSYSGQNLLTES